MKETVRGPKFDVRYLEPYGSSSYDRDSGWGRPSAGLKLVKAEVSTYQYEARGHDMPIAGYHSYSFEGPNARANCSVSTNGFGGMAQLSAGKIKTEVGYARAELNPNLTTGATIGRNGFSTRVGGASATITRKSVDFHTPLGSFGMRSPW